MSGGKPQTANVNKTKVVATSKPKVVAKSKPNRMAKTAVQASVRNNRKHPVRRVRMRRGACYSRHLRVAINFENKGALAYSNKNYDDAVNNYMQAADHYVNDSQHCKNPKDRVFALDKSKRLRALVVQIKNKFANCDEKIGYAQGLQKRAYSDEQSGEFDLAQDGYMNAYRAYLSIPNACNPDQYLTIREEALNKSKLLGCEHYIKGIKQYNLAFDAMSRAQKIRAASYYKNAAKFFDSAINRCGFVDSNNRLLDKLMRASQIKASRLNQ